MMSNFFDSSVGLKLKPFKRATATIIKELSDSRVLEEEFLFDPAGYLTSRLHSEAAAKIPRGRLNGANRFLLSIMSNQKFLAWIKDYQEKSLAVFEADPLAIIDKDKARLDLAKAMIEFGDPEIIGAILPGNLTFRRNEAVEIADAITERRIWIVDVAVEIEVVVYAVVAAAVFGVVVAAIGVAPLGRFGQDPLLRDAFVGTREMNAIAEALIKLGTDLRARSRI